MYKSQRGFSTVGWLLIIAAVAVVGFAGWYVWQNNNKDSEPSNTTGSESSTTNTSQDTAFGDPKKSAHFESSTPAHGSKLAAVPVDVVIDFNFDLASNSTIKIMKDGKDYGTDEVSIDSNKLAMRRQMDKNAPDGVYTVEYTACWPDRTCHDGNHQFAIDRSLLESYQDMRSQKTITVKLSDTKFQPMNLRLSPGTMVTWVNDDSEEHYVNTDSHPAHTHVLSFNSKALAKGASYSFTFEKVGAYPYHCSAHAAEMTANIVVEES